MLRTDHHHIFWCRRIYRRGWAKKLRTHWYCLVEIPKDTLHAQIHHEIDCVPVPRAISIKIVLGQLDFLEGYGAISPCDSIEKRLGLFIMLFGCIEPDTTKALTEQLEIVRRYQKAP